MSKVIVFATPVFFLLIALEYLWSRRAAARVPADRAYGLSDMINSVSLGVLSQLSGVLSKVLSVGIYTAVFSSVAVFHNPDFWNTWYGYVIALIFYDLCYYWLHRAGHEVSLFWAAHVVHHQSQHYNLSTALRQTSSGAFFGWIFYLPMAVAGVPPLVFGIVALIDLLYQFWVHTEQVGKLGWFDRWFCSPSNHRVHHAVNDPYIDRNYGGLLIIWDRIFGSFQEEHEPCVYGTRGQLNSWDPLWANAEVYAALARDSWHTRRWIDKLRVWFKPPGWQPADLAATHPKPPFRLDAVTHYNPALTTTQQWFATMQFALSLGVVSVFLWHADSMSLSDAAIWVSGIAACMWAQGLYLQSRLSLLEVLMLEASVLAAISALGMLGNAMVWKPVPMVLAIIFVAHRAISAGGIGKFDALLIGALVFSLTGDVLLMLPGDFFIAGLSAFLVAHCFYIALFRQGQPWLASRRALVIVLAIAAGMYAVLMPHLPGRGLQLAVAAYVMVIALMASQALGRAHTLATPSSRWVAVGACIFMTSDSLLAINRFLTPLPLAAFWILVTYFGAQMLMVHHARAGDSPQPR